MPIILDLTLWRGDDEVPVRVRWIPPTRNQWTERGEIEGDPADIEVIEGPADLSAEEHDQLLKLAAETVEDREAAMWEDEYERRREAERESDR